MYIERDIDKSWMYLNLDMVAPQTFARTLALPSLLKRVPLETFRFCAGNRGFTKEDSSVY